MSASAIKTCRVIHAEHQHEWSEMYDRYSRDMKEARAREFPIGCKVRWTANGGHCSGIVTRHPEFTPDKITVRNAKSKAEYEKQVFELEHE